MSHLNNTQPQFYYVDLFLNVYGVDSYWFYMAEILYMIWNAINDPLCVWLQDHSDLGGMLLLSINTYVLLRYFMRDEALSFVALALFIIQLLYRPAELC